MIRQVTKLPLSRLFSRTAANKALPGLATAATSVCEFSTGRRSRAEEKPAKIDDNKEKAVAAQHETPQGQWHPFFHPIRGFDEFLARDPFFEPFFKDPFFDEFRRDMMPVLRSPPRPSPTSLSSRLVRASPSYEIKETDGAYEIAVDIPEGLTASDLKVELERDGTVVHVSGERQMEEDGTTTTTRFSKRFTLGDNMDTDQLNANFSDGCLVMSVPKKEVVAETKRLIPITNKPHDEISEEDVRHKTFTDAFDESDWAETGKQKVA